MPKFNVKANTQRRLGINRDSTQNYEKGLAFKTDNKTELTLRFLTYIVGEPKFYTPDAELETVKVQELVRKVAAEDPEYLLRLAAYARNEMHLRSAPILMLIEVAQYDSVKPYIAEWTPRIIRMRG